MRQFKKGDGSMNEAFQRSTFYRAGVRAYVLAYLFVTDAPMVNTTVGKILGWKAGRSRIHRLMKGLAADGYVESPGKGRWQITDAGKEIVAALAGDTRRMRTKQEVRLRVLRVQRDAALCDLQNVRQAA